MVLDKVYVVKANLLDSNSNKITLTQNIAFKTELDQTYFEVLAQNSIGSEVLVKVKRNINLEKAAKTVVKTYLDKINNKDPRPYTQGIIRKTLIQDEKEVVITKPVSIKHPTDLILLPLIEGSQGEFSGQIYEIKAKGGSGTYTIKTEDSKVAAV